MLAWLADVMQHPVSMTVVMGTLAATDAAPFQFLDPSLQKSVIYMCTGVGSYFLYKAYRVRKMTEPQRRKDDGRFEQHKVEVAKVIDGRFGKYEQRLDIVEGLQRNMNTETRTVHEEVDVVKRSVDDGRREIGVVREQLIRLNTQMEGYSKSVDRYMELVLEHISSGGR
jgi:hypothetical protein